MNFKDIRDKKKFYKIKTISSFLNNLLNKMY